MKKLWEMSYYYLNKIEREHGRLVQLEQ